MLFIHRMADKKKKGWHDDDMRQALAACKDRGMSMYASAKRYGVPRMTLSDRMLGKVAVNARIGHPTALTKCEEDALMNYIDYMHNRRFPIDRSQVISLAWAIDLKRDPGKRVFGAQGPTLHWWRGFRDRHPELTLRKAESVDRGRVDNADPEIIQKYFDVLKETLDTNALHNRTHLIFNCDEAAIALNKTSRKVVVPRRNKHTHTVTNASTQHVSVLCCVAAAGTAIPPLIVFSKGLPAGRGYEKEGPINASYSSSDSGFVDRHMYTEWFSKVFLRHAPRERPLLLLQDGASAHMGVELIDAAILNDVILLCFPRKLTHILQPCDVGIYRTMKANVCNTMQQIRMLRGEMHINKTKVPAILREVFEKTFTPALIIESFRKCGISPFSRDTVSMDLVKKQDVGTVVAELTLDVVSPSEVPADVEVLADGTSLICPPSLALDAIESSLTPRKMSAYQRRDAKGDTCDKDPVYATWRYLKQQVEGCQPQPLQHADHPLLKAGLIPKRLVDVFHTPPEKGTHLRRGATTTARVLTSDEISNAFRDRDRKKKLAIEEKEQRKRIRLEKKAKKAQDDQARQTTRLAARKRKRPSTPMETTTSVTATAPSATIDRQEYFAGLQTLLSNCSTYTAMKLAIPVSLPYPLQVTSPSDIDLQLLPDDTISTALLANMTTNQDTSSLRPVRVEADGNCFPRAGSLLFTGSEARHTEIRVRIVREMLLHDDDYLDSGVLSEGTSSNDPSMPDRYAQFSPAYVPGHKLTQRDIRKIYEDETMSVVRPGAYCGIWQLHALSSVANTPIRSVYPGMGPPKTDLCRMILPRMRQPSVAVHRGWYVTFEVKHLHGRQ